MMFALLTELYNTVYCSWSMAEFLKVDLDFNAAADYVVETPLQLSRDAGLLDGVQKVLIELCYRLPALRLFKKPEEIAVQRTGCGAGAPVLEPAQT